MKVGGFKSSTGHMTKLLQYLGDDRHYHTFVHIGYMLENLQKTFPEFYYDKLLKLAIAYHDCEYFIGRKTGLSEEESAKAATQELEALGYEKYERDDVERLILLTIGHQTDRSDIRGSILIDLDLAGLASPMYWQNKDWIRKEFKYVTDDQWRDGRIKFLESFLNREYIYQSDKGIKLWESKARDNMIRELELLSEE